MRNLSGHQENFFRFNITDACKDDTVTFELILPVYQSQVEKKTIFSASVAIRSLLKSQGVKQSIELLN